VHSPLFRVYHKLLLAVAICPVIADAQPLPPTSEGCSTTECHGQIMDSQFLHQPVAESACGECHVVDAPGGRPHPATKQAPGSTPFTLTTTPGCIRCHADADVEHATEHIACEECHAVHGGESSALLRGPGEAVCLDCHSSEFEPSRASAAEGEASQDESNLRSHGPADEGRCSPCHRVHDGPLRGSLPPGSYARYERSAYSTCFDACHDPEIVEDAKTRSATRFRNGSDNLHFRHVAKGERGRTCRLCHAAHQAPGRGLVRRGMPYGAELLTLEFTPSSSGGRCATSCHIDLEYDRTKAIPSRMRIE
jgi:predicted CXXCH cytochrome family protein